MANPVIKFIRKVIVHSLLKDVLADNRSHFKKIETNLKKIQKLQIKAVSPSAIAKKPIPKATLSTTSELSRKPAVIKKDPKPYDLVVTLNEISRHHGTGILLKRLLWEHDAFIHIRSKTHFNGESIGHLQLILDHQKKTRDEAFLAVATALQPYTIRRILCVPFYPSDVWTALAASELFQVPICLYLMDDQNIHFPGISNDLMREIIHKSQLRLAIGWELRAAYEQKYLKKFWLLPPTITPRLIRRQPTLMPHDSSEKTCALIGNIWSAAWLSDLRVLIKESGLVVHWYGNTEKKVNAYDEQELALDGIQVQGFVPEDELQRRLSSYLFAIVPTGSQDPNDTHAWQTKLSLPSRLPYLMVTTGLPILVLAIIETPATAFVRRFGIGLTSDYQPENFLKAVKEITTEARQVEFRRQAASVAGIFSSEAISAWIWQSLALGRSIDQRFEHLFQEKMGFDSRGHFDVGAYCEVSSQAGDWLEMDLGMPYPVACLRLPQLEKSIAEVSTSLDGKLYTPAPTALEISFLLESPIRSIRWKSESISKCEVWVTQAAEAAVDYCRRHGIESGEMLDYTRKTRPDDNYIFTHLTLRGNIDLLRVTKLGRFGNAIIQCIHSIYLAKKLGIPQVSWPKHEFIQPNFLTPSRTPLVANFSITSIQQEATLEGMFYYCKPFVSYIQKMNDQDVLDIVSETIRPSLSALFSENKTSIEANDLVIHLRAGDIFKKGSSVHPYYAQPPLVYYQWIIEKHRENYPEFSVTLVFEDRGNPCIDALENWLAEQSIPYLAQCGSLREDLQYILSATNLVCGYGTFGPITSLLSHNIQKLYTFREVVMFSTIRAKGVQVQTISTKPTTYIEAGAWVNSEEQRTMMLQFPRENLKIS